MARIGFILGEGSWFCGRCRKAWTVYIRQCLSWTFVACPDCGAIAAIPPRHSDPASVDPLAPSSPQEGEAR